MTRERKALEELLDKTMNYLKDNSPKTRREIGDAIDSAAAVVLSAAPVPGTDGLMPYRVERLNENPQRGWAIIKRNGVKILFDTEKDARNIMAYLLEGFDEGRAGQLASLAMTPEQACEEARKRWGENSSAYEAKDICRVWNGEKWFHGTSFETAFASANQAKKLE